MARQTNRRRFVKAFAGAAGLATFGRIGPAGAQRRRRKPNLLIIHTDQLSSWALSIYAPLCRRTPNYGETLVETPNIDRIGREGALLTNFVTNSALCSPSRGCLFTGRYPHCHGAYQNNIELDRDEVTIAQVLKGKGYETGYSGKWHLDGPPKPGPMVPERAMGFDDCRYMFNRGHWKRMWDDEQGEPQLTGRYQDIGDEETYMTDFLASKTIEFTTRQRTAPFCYVVSFPDPHGPFTVREPYMSMYDPAAMTVPHSLTQAAGDGDEGAAAAEEAMRQRKAHYCGLVKCIDDNVKRILDALEAHGILDDTIIVFTTDHGEYMGEHGLYGKNQWYRTAYQIPFLVRWPRKIRPNTLVSKFVTTVDVQQTLLRLMDIKPCGREQGRDASALLRGGKAKWEDVAWIHHASLQAVGIFTPKYELVLKASGEHMLFDREHDPEQANNLAHDAAHRTTFEELARRLTEHHRQVGSPAMSWLEAGVEFGGGIVDPPEDGVVYRRALIRGDTLPREDGEGGRRNGGPNRANAFTRLLTTPEGLMAADSEYLISFDYESHGLVGDNSTFYFTLRPGDDRSAQTGPLYWQAEEGEAGRKEHRLLTGGRADYTLILGIRGNGAIDIRNLTIRKVR